MPDIVSPAVRSRMMSGIRGKDTKPELLLRSALHRRGLRFRLHAKKLPGRPDLVFPRYDAVVLVHGCFWHAHEGCAYFKRPSTRQAFWDAKFESNKTRDRRDIARLEEMGWRVAVVWECATRRDLEPTLDRLYAWIVDGGRGLEVPR